jgi:muconolactone delta-isomerase
MKFLVIGKMKDSAMMLPPAAFAQILEASMAAIKQLQKEGKVVDYYYSPGTMQTINILNYDNADQWAEDQQKIPILSYATFETYPLADGPKYFQGMLETIRKATSKSK